MIEQNYADVEATIKSLAAHYARRAGRVHV